MLGFRADDDQVREGPDPATWEYADVDPPEEKDWVAEGAVTPVKNQGHAAAAGPSRPRARLRVSSP